MNIEKYSCYEFEIKKAIIFGEPPERLRFVYVIFDPDYKPSVHTEIRESDEWYDTEEQARNAAIEHISLLENGEG